MRPRSSPFVVALLVALGSLAWPARSGHAQGRDDDLGRARVLDHEGVRAYREGRYKDAIRAFSEARRLGGPPSEMWNIAKCHLRLDEPEEASTEIQKYLAQPGLSGEDRAEATDQLQELQKRRSTLTVSSSPSGAAVFIDGRRETSGQTPLSVEVGPGAHAVAIESSGYRSYTTQVDAHFGRGVIVDAQLTRGDGTPPPPPPPPRGKPARPGPSPPAPAEPDHLRRFLLGAQVGVFFSRLGGYGEGARAGFALSGAYVVYAVNDLSVAAGLRLLVTSDAWTDTIAAGPRGINCSGEIPLDESGTEMSVYGIGTVAYRITPRLRISGDGGLGIATYSASEVGGDLFIGNCQPGFGSRPALHFGGEVSYNVTPALRIVGAPVMLELHSAFDGVRSTPIDATGLWLRFGMGLGLAVDL